MAIVFISPRKKQQMFFWGIALSLIVFLAIISLIVFLPDFLSKNSNTPADMTSLPDITVNLNILDSDKVKNLQPPSSLPIAFTYTVQDKNGIQIQGNISAASKQDAQSILEKADFKVISLKEANIGRTNPFVSY